MKDELEYIMAGLGPETEARKKDFAEALRKLDLKIAARQKKHKKKEEKFSGWWLLALPLLAFKKPFRRRATKRMSKFF